MHTRIELLAGQLQCLDHGWLLGHRAYGLVQRGEILGRRLGRGGQADP